MKLQSVNPATGQVLETFDETPREQVDRLLGRAHAAFHDWRALSEYGIREFTNVKSVWVA